jgi:RNA polymerase sigma-70 factor (ECF subfamily)
MDAFEEHRKYLFGIAYRMLGSAADADDMVQETFIRWRAADRAAIHSPRAFLSTVITRICLDRLKEAHTARVDYVGPWLPEPILTEGGDAVETAESISLAFLVLLESLTPLERAVHLLHDVFDYRHEEIAAIVGRDAATCRKILERARKDIVARRPRYAPSREAHHEMVARFATAVATGDASALERLLAEDVVSIGDGGGKALAARKPIEGRAKVLKFWASLHRLFPAEATADVREVNGLPALVVRLGAATVGVVHIETDGERIFAVRSTLNPDKLARIQ